jgi:hypothetical protein
MKFFASENPDALKAIAKKWLSLWLKLLCYKHIKWLFF